MEEKLLKLAHEKLAVSSQPAADSGVPTQIVLPEGVRIKKEKEDVVTIKQKDTPGDKINQPTEDAVHIKKEKEDVASVAMVLAAEASTMEASAITSTAAGEQEMEVGQSEEVPGSRDISDDFLPLTDPQVASAELGNKEKFVQAEIICPGIALKKMKMALGDAGQHADDIVGFLGCDVVKKYRADKPLMSSMLIGNFVDDYEQVVKFLPSQLKHRPLVALCLSADSQIQISAVSCCG